MDRIYTLAIAYECESSLGNSLNLQDMTKEFLRVFLKKTSALYALLSTSSQDIKIPINSVGKTELFQLVVDTKPNVINKYSIVEITKDELAYKVLYLQLKHHYMAFVYSQQNPIDIHVIANIFYSLKDKIDLGIKACVLHERMELALLGSNDGIWDWNLVENSAYFSPRWKEMLGYKDHELPNDFSLWSSMAHPEDAPKVIEEIHKHIEKKSPYVDIEFRLKHKDGHWVWINSRAKSVLDKDGNAIRLIGTHTDITKQKEQEFQYLERGKILENSLKLTDNIIDNVPTRIFWKDKNGKYLGANKAFLDDAKLKSRSEIIGKDDFDLPWGKTEAKGYREHDFGVMDSGIPVLNFEETQTRENGNSFYLLTSKIPLRNVDDSLRGILGTYTDITEQRRMEKRLQEQKRILQHQAHHDALTGLANRVLLHDRLDQDIRKAARNHTKLALLFIDLDRFKEINDSLGHDIGDIVLKKITSRLKSAIRSEDTVARLGGDEFTIILQNLVNIQDASLIANKLLHTLSQIMQINEHELYVSSSIGISVYPDDGKDTQSLLKYADSAMYKAKEEGRNNVQYYSAEMTELAFERVVMETALRNGIKNKELIVYYQPQIEGTTNKLIGTEALVRWQHPTMGLVFPDNFIPLAESTGLIIELDRYVMKAAMEQYVQWYKQGLNPGTLALNLAVKQLQQDDLIETIQKLLEETKCKPEWIEMEVTESQVMTHPEEASITLQQINDLGIKLAVDDFGTGYSSLAYLKRLPIDKLKIDQVFVRDLIDDNEDAQITKAIIALAKSLNLRIIAEGVETNAQKEFLLQNGCVNLQGYLYSKPVSANMLEKMLLYGVKR